MAIKIATKNPMIVVVMAGGPVDISWAKVREMCVCTCTNMYLFNVFEYCSDQSTVPLHYLQIAGISQSPMLMQLFGVVIVNNR